jgi:hypothetical protein
VKKYVKEKEAKKKTRYARRKETSKTGQKRCERNKEIRTLKGKTQSRKKNKGEGQKER